MSIRHPVSVRGWALWTQPPGKLAYDLLVKAVTVGATVAVLPVHVTTTDLTILATLTLLGVTQAELGRQVERVRRRIAGTGHINLTSVWLLPAVLLIPPALVAVLAATLYWHLYFRSWYRLKQVRPYRTASSASTAILTCYLTHAAVSATGVDGARDAVHAGWSGAAAVTVGIGTYFVVNVLLIIPMYGIGGLQDLFGGWTDNLLELATLCLGALLALILAALPATAVLIIPPLFLLHRAVLIDQLESAARRDDKTGLWTIAGWHRLARRELARPGTSFGVLMVDLDHFKRVNDTHGHLAGDVVLKAVSDTIVATVRDRDSIGRFGGEEFVVLLPDMAEGNVRAVAERIRTAIARLEITVDGQTIGGLSASIGVATYPESGAAIERLLKAADTAMYRAKANGRNQVVG